MDQTIIAILTALAIWLAYLEYRLSRLFRGKDASSLEKVLAAISGDIENLHLAQAEREKYLAHLEARLRRSIQGISTVRFNPFRDVGSNQSFAVALLDEHGNGVVLSTLYNRDRTSVFAKPVQAHQSEYELTAEEQQAISQARR